MSLLQYLVSHYVQKYDKGELPVPEPSDISESAQVDFDRIQDELRKVKTSVKECEGRVDRVIQASAEEHVEPFKTSMTTFLERGGFCY